MVRCSLSPEPFLNTYFTDPENDLHNPKIHQLVARLLPLFSKAFPWPPQPSMTH